MAENSISGVDIAGEAPGPDGDVAVAVRFSVRGPLRDAFNEKEWSAAYEKYDNTFKIKYGVKLRSGGLKRRVLGEVDTYRKASVFWTRNPKLVNPMKEKRIWVQVAKNFKPIIRLTEEEVRGELFDFEERIILKGSELGPGIHKVSAEIWASWQKHEYTSPGSVKAHSGEAEITIN